MRTGDFVEDSQSVSVLRDVNLHGAGSSAAASLHSQHRDNQSARQRCTLQARVDQSSRSQALRGGLCRIASASLVSSPEDVPAACMVLALVRIVLVKARETRWRDARTLCSASRMTSGTQSDSCRDVIP